MSVRPHNERLTAPWQGIISYLSRARWRSTPHSSKTSSFILSSHINKSINRTTRQLRRTYQQILRKHRLLAMARQKERLTPDKIDVKFHYLNDINYYNSEQALAQYYYRHTKTSSIVQRVLNEIVNIIGKSRFCPRSVLDIGSGVGSASYATLNFFRTEYDNLDSTKVTIRWIHCIDPSHTMNDFSSLVFRDMGSNLTRITHGTEISGSSVRSFDLALMVYTLTEIPSISASLALAAMAWERLLPNGFIVIIEPGTSDSFQTLCDIRNLFLSTFPMNLNGYESFSIREVCHIVAPCTHNGSCPIDGCLDTILKDDIGSKNYIKYSSTSNICNFVHSFSSKERNSFGEKFCYLVIQKRIVGDKVKGLQQKNYEQTSALSRINFVDLLQQRMLTRKLNKQKSLHETAFRLEKRHKRSSVDTFGHRILRLDPQLRSWGRIIRAPIKNRGHILIDHCIGSLNNSLVLGRVSRKTITKTNQVILPGIFGIARKACWGGLWPNLETNRNI